MKKMFECNKSDECQNDICAHKKEHAKINMSFIETDCFCTEENHCAWINKDIKCVVVEG